jgi:hypothetical protein
MYLLLFSIFYFGCNNETKTSYVNSNDSARGLNKNVNEKVSNDDSELTQMVEEYVQSYNKTFLIDTSYLFANDTIDIFLKHECLRDSAVVIPKKYVGVYGLDRFITHNFSSSIIVKKNHHIIEERYINKDNFEKFLDPNLKNYGVLLYPSIKYFPDSIEISYSLSIPLTDIGTGVSAIIKNDGLLSFVER